MGVVALTSFIGLWIWGDTAFGWTDPDGRIRLALFACFVFGTLLGYRVSKPN